MLVCGLDEVGRGCVAGPIVACAALFKTDLLHTKDNSPIKGVKDSKKFSSRKSREKVRDLILACNQLYGFSIVEISAEEIDDIGIESANHKAFTRAVMSLQFDPELLYVDGNKRVRIWEGKQIIEPKADDTYWPVGAASILAKCHRDNLMYDLHARYGHYGWDTNAGYGTKVHMKGILEHGLTAYHRRTFLTNLGENSEVSEF